MPDLPPTTPFVPPGPDLAAEAAMLARACRALAVPVAWCDGQGRLLGANPAFAPWFGGAQAGDLADVLRLDTAAADALRRGQGLTQAWATADDAAGNPTRLQLTVVRDGPLQVATLRPPLGASSADDLLAVAQRLGRLGVWERNLQTGAGHWDPQIWQLFGHTPRAHSPDIDAAIALMHADDRSQVRQAYQDSVHAVGSYSCRYRVVRPDGSLRHARTLWEVLPDAHGRPQRARGIVVDETEASLLARRLQMTTNAAGVGVWSRALDGPAQVHWDDQMRALHDAPAGHQPPGLIAYLDQYVHPDDRPTVGDAVRTLMSRREGLIDLDLRIVLPGGRVRRLACRTAIETDAGRRHLYGVMFDVTERHATERRLREAAERAALAARGAGIGTWESAPDGAVGVWDEQMFRLRGLPPRQGPVTRAEMLSWAHPDDRAGNRRALEEAVARGTSSNHEFRVVWPDGTVRWLASRSAPVPDEQGRPARRIGINWDITDARTAAAVQQEKLLAQRESQAKSRFLARISHELRTPLNAVLGFAQLLQADGQQADPATWQRWVQQVLASGEHLVALIDDVLALASVESDELPLNLQPLSLSAMAAGTAALLEPLARRHGVAVRLNVPEDVALLADPVRLRQVLLNLLSNAIKYNRQGGQVDVAVQPADAGWTLTVRDTGPGLSDAQLAHLFEPFNRLGRENGEVAGSGIGLAIVRAAVQQMGGSVVASSTRLQSAISGGSASATGPVRTRCCAGQRWICVLIRRPLPHLSPLAPRRGSPGR
jgi:signal transduction histidine kinase